MTAREFLRSFLLRGEIHYGKKGKIIIQISKREAFLLNNMGFRFGSDGILHHTYSRSNKKYYMTESPKAMNALKKLRSSQIIEHKE